LLRRSGSGRTPEGERVLELAEGGGTPRPNWGTLNTFFHPVRCPASRKKPNEHLHNQRRAGVAIQAQNPIRFEDAGGGIPSGVAYWGGESRSWGDKAPETIPLFWPKRERFTVRPWGVWPNHRKEGKEKDSFSAWRKSVLPVLIHQKGHSSADPQKIKFSRARQSPFVVKEKKKHTFFFRNSWGLTGGKGGGQTDMSVCPLWGGELMELYLGEGLNTR